MTENLKAQQVGGRGNFKSPSTTSYHVLPSSEGTNWGWKVVQIRSSVELS